ncbi:PREDICTED: 60S ribosomal protein L14-like [Priapulus caudatus]|uniref:Large ribosomal subunit protein eL14 n=1 Tax=Priapulus caudatus TaxID=37621 RepID=A0ABM1F8U7_PRICU|nr:PREDICTED: 60S ribosomal protein L14-like [Priapulus caudatus]
MPFTKFVEAGRIAYIPFGTDHGKLCVIVDVIDQNRALIDGPCSGVKRQEINFKRMHLTKFLLKLHHSARTRTVRKAWAEAGIEKQWKETTWAKKIDAREKRAVMSDFDRFKLMKAKQMRNRLIRHEMGKLTWAKKGKQPRVWKRAEKAK